MKSKRLNSIRHTQATQLLANGVDVKTVQTRLGHANASITLGWYAHAIPEKDHEAADLFGNLLESNAPTSENAVEASKESVETEDAFFLGVQILLGMCNNTIVS